jgi:uroporphyrinogen decarboxylase
MTGKERILKALACEEPDRVPVFELAINEASIVKLGEHFTDDLPPVKHVSEMTLEDKVQYVDLLALILKELGNDGISTTLIISKEPVDADLAKDKYGTTYMLSEVGEPLPVDGPVKGPQDLKKVAGIEPDPADFLMLEYMIQKMGSDVAHFFGVPGPFRTSWQLMGGMDSLLLAYVREPDFVLELARVATDFNKAAVAMAADRGADAITLQGDLAFNTSTLMSPDQYRKFLKPFTAEIIEFAHQKGLKVIKHSDGNLWPILEDLVEVGFDGLHPIQPQCMDIQEVKTTVQGRTAVVGNIDCSFLLPFGSEEEVEKTVAETIRAAAPGGGYIISSSNTIHPGVKAENYIAMVRAARKYGTYPIEAPSLS